MAILKPYLLLGVSIPVTVAMLSIFLAWHHPFYFALLFAVFLTYQQYHYGQKRPKDRKLSDWTIKDPVGCLRKGDPVVDELVQGGAFARSKVKYGNLVQMLRDKIEEQSPPHERQQHRRHVELCQTLLAQVERVPEWVDEQKLERAIQLYKEHVVLVSAGLAIALVESYAFPIDAEVLFISGGLTNSTNGTIRRLMETGMWVYSVMHDGVKVGSPGHSAVINVRFLHAFARKKCLENESWASNNVPVDTSAPPEEIMGNILKGRIEGEMPVNQATMCATLFLFCQVVMEVATIRGADISDEDKECYWHYWRYVGYLIGVDESVLPESYFDGLAARKSPLYRGRQQPNAKSRTLSKGTIDSYNNLPHIPFQPDLFFVTTRKFLGDELSDQLGVPRPALWNYFTWYLAKGLFVLSCVLNSVCPPAKWVWATAFTRYVHNAFQHYFILDKLAADSASASCLGKSGSSARCPFGL